MRSWARAALLGLAVVVAVPGCGGGGAKAAGRDASVGDPALAPYLAGLASLARLEAEALDAVAAVTGDRYTTDEALAAALKDRAIPTYRKFVDGLRALPSPPGDRKRLHDRLVVLAGAELAALEGLARAVEAGDGNAVIEVNREQRRLAEEIDGLLTEWAGVRPH